MKEINNMSKTHQEGKCLFENRKTLSLEEIDLCKPDILASSQFPQLRKVDSNFSMIQSFQNFDKFDQLQDDISFIETLEYQKLPLTQDNNTLNARVNQQTVKQIKPSTSKKLTNSHFLSEDEQEKSNQENQFEQQNSLDQKSSSQVCLNLKRNLKQYWNKQVPKISEIFKIREKKDKSYFSYFDYSQKTL